MIKCIEDYWYWKAIDYAEDNCNGDETLKEKLYLAYRKGVQDFIDQM